MEDGAKARSLRSAALVIAVLLAQYAVLLRLLSTGVPEAGDGVFHFQHARFAWKHAELLFDHWAKPLYTLLASPFAQLGLWGIALMNAVLFVFAAMWIGSFTGQRRPGLRFIAPVLLFTAPMYLHTLVAGMTEVLFGTLTVLVLWLLQRERPVAAAVVASFMPYARPEYVGFVPFLAAWLVWERQWKVLPWLAFGSVVYALLGWPVHGSPLWYFTHDPYMGNDLYGRGDFDLFWRYADEIVGEPLRVLFLLAVPALLALWYMERDRRREHLRVIMLGVLPVLAIWLIHSYARWKGGMGSLGLLRVLATTVPLIVLVVLHTLEGLWTRWVPRRPWTIGTGVLLLLVLANWGYNDVRKKLPLPYKGDTKTRAITEAAERVKALRTPGQRLVYLDPLVGVKCDVDPWDTTTAMTLYEAGMHGPGYGMRIGDLFAWDAHFCANEGQVPMDNVLRDTLFLLEQVVAPDERINVLGDHPYIILIFRRTPAARWWTEDTLLVWKPGHQEGLAAKVNDSIPCDRPGVVMCLGGAEFPLDVNDLRTNEGNELFVDLHVEADVAEGTDGLFLVFKEEDGGTLLRYHEEPPRNGRYDFDILVQVRSATATNALYFWNRDGQPFALRSLRITLRRWYQRPLVSR